MFETVIVPLDGSPHAECALPYAIDEARRHQATMVLLHVIPRPEPCTSTVRGSGPVPWQGEWPFEDLDRGKARRRGLLAGRGDSLCAGSGNDAVRRGRGSGRARGSGSDAP